MINHNVGKSPDQRGPLPHSWWKFISILIEADWWYIKDLSQSFDEVLWSASTYVQSWSAFFSPGVLISPFTKNLVCRIFILIAFSSDLSLYAKFHRQPKWKSCPSISSLQLLKSLFGALVVGFLIGWCRELLKCPNVTSPKSCAVFIISASYLGVTWASIEDDYMNRRPGPSSYHEG